jgi:hypothetical protein
MSNEIEIVSTALEDALVDQLEKEMSVRGFALLTVIGVCEEDGEIATLGDVRVTHSAEFAHLLRDLADQVEHAADKHAIPRSMGLLSKRAQSEGHLPKRSHTEGRLFRKFWN